MGEASPELLQLIEEISDKIDSNNEALTKRVDANHAEIKAIFSVEIFPVIRRHDTILTRHAVYFIGLTVMFTVFSRLIDWAIQIVKMIT